MSKKDESCATILFAIALIPALLLGNSYSIVSLWRWFAVPLGAPAIGMAHAFGIGLLLEALKSSGRAAPKEDETIWTAAIYGVVRCLAIYGAGYLAHLVMT